MTSDSLHTLHHELFDPTLGQQEGRIQQHFKLALAFANGKAWGQFCSLTGFLTSFVSRTVTCKVGKVESPLVLDSIMYVITYILAHYE